VKQRENSLRILFCQNATPQNELFIQQVLNNSFSASWYDMYKIQLI